MELQRIERTVVEQNNVMVYLAITSL